MLQKGIVFLLIVTLWSCEIKKDHFFTKMPSSRTGITFKNLLKETNDFNVLTYGYLYNGGGVSIGDINNDGLPDIYFTGNMVASRLYLNRGNWDFEEVAEEAGVTAAGLWNTGTTMADVNGDGWLDIYVCRSAAKNPDSRKNLLFINTTGQSESGQVSFTEQGGNYGVADPAYSTQAAFFDYDLDGDLDLYLLNHSVQRFAGLNPNIVMLKQKIDPNFGDKLYRNEQGKFRDVTGEANIKSNVLGFGLGIAVSDLNQDGWPDIYVSNDYNEQDYLYINNQDGTFSEQLKDYLDHVSLFSMGSDVADFNNDGFTDIMTLDMWPEENERQKVVIGPDNWDKYQRLSGSGFYHQTMRNMLQLNLGGNSFSEIGQLAGVSATDWSWSSLFADFDNDGYKDLFITNGYKRDYTNMDFLTFVANEKLKEQQGGPGINTMDLIGEMPAIAATNYIFKNNGDLTFTKKTEEWGFDEPSMSNGAAYGDLDNDGDLDLVVNNIDQEAFVYRNNSETFTQNNFLKVSLQGKALNSSGIGAKVRIQCGGKSFFQELMPTRGFQSSVEHEMTFGLGNCSMIESVTVTWPDQTVQLMENVPAGQEIHFKQEEATLRDASTSARSPLMATVDAGDLGLNFQHRENYFVDFKSQGLLPHMLSTLGPRLAIGDVNEDGMEDVYIGGAAGQSGQLFIQNPSGNFDVSKTNFDGEKEREDLDATFFDADGDGDLDLYVVSGGNGLEPDAPELQDRLYINSGGDFDHHPGALPSMPTSGSCVTAADYDRDGDLDLFVGGRLTSGQYPLTPRSYLLENSGQGVFEDVTPSELREVGMVTDAVWSDYNADEMLDLIVVGEWMNITVLENDGSNLTDVTSAAGLNNSEGWWNRIVEGDFDNDGDPDYVLGNFGWNSQIKASPSEPACLYVKDFDNNGTIDPILCYYIQGESYPAFSKDDMERQMPLVKKRYLKYQDYANKKLTDIFTSEELQDTLVFKARNFSSSYLENLGNGQFELKVLPIEAQVSPVFGILAEDFNGDGYLDVLLAGNFSATRVKFGKYDANKGVLLEGNGNGGFEAMESSSSGLIIRGEVRDLVSVNNGVGSKYVLVAKNNDFLEILAWPVTSPNQ